ncbi:MAG: hypothetical protein AB1393_09025 [Candidatus Edwardsbacteria bacterium]
MLKTANTNGAIQKIRHDLQDNALKWIAESSRLVVCHFLEVSAFGLENPGHVYHIIPIPGEIDITQVKADIAHEEYPNYCDWWVIIQ